MRVNRAVVSQISTEILKRLELHMLSELCVTRLLPQRDVLLCHGR